jgi:hypothetical protein
MILSQVVQIILAIVLTFMLLFIAYALYNYESLQILQQRNNIRKEITIFDGIMDFANTQWTFNTYNKSLISYKDLTPSINQNGGAEYSYNFWIYKDHANLSNISSSDVVLLLRGNNVKIPYLNNTNCEVVNNGSYILVKNPLIRMKSDGTAIIVEYNTITNPDSYREYGANEINCSTNNWYDNNKGLLGIYNLEEYVYDKKWFMFTVVLQEISPDNDLLFKNRTNCKMYINGINVLDRTVESPYNGSYGSAVMKHTRAPLYVNPGDIFSKTGNTGDNPFTVQGDGGSGLQMANLSYYNYALTELDIVSLFNKEFTKSQAIVPIDKDGNYTEDKFAIANVSEMNQNLPIPF